MQFETKWTILGVRLAQVIPLAVATATIGFATPAMAAGTAAGTPINNTATATFNDPGGVQVTVPSNTVSFIVDEILDVTVTSADPGDVVVTPGSTNRVLSYTVTNTGNGNEGFRLTPVSALGGDQFDPTTTSIFIDANGNNTYDPGVDRPYTPGASEVIARDTTIRVFILSTIPAGLNDADRGFVDLAAEAVTGTGPAGTTFAGQGDNGGDAVVGLTGARGNARGTFVVQSANITFVKEQTVVDPFGGAETVPGAFVTYRLTATVTGSGTLTNLAVADPIPANTTYQPGSLTLQGAALTDPVDGDAGEVASGNVAVRLGSVAGGQTRVITFRVRIN